MMLTIFAATTNGNVELTASAGAIVNVAIRRNRISGGHRDQFRLPACGWRCRSRPALLPCRGWQASFRNLGLSLEGPRLGNARYTSEAKTPPIPASRVQSVFAPQSLERFDRASRGRPRPDFAAPCWRRGIIFGGSFAITAYLVRELYFVLSVGSFTWLEVALMILFTVNIFWLALSFMTALAGFVIIGPWLAPIAR